MEELDNFNPDTVKELGNGSFTVSRFHDSLGRELEAHKCEYCGKVRPVKVFNGFDRGRESYSILMVEYRGYNEKKMWRCIECSSDIKNKIEGKDV